MVTHISFCMSDSLKGSGTPRSNHGQVTQQHDISSSCSLNPHFSFEQCLESRGPDHLYMRVLAKNWGWIKWTMRMRERKELGNINVQEEQTWTERKIPFSPFQGWQSNSDPKICSDLFLISKKWAIHRMKKKKGIKPQTSYWSRAETDEFQSNVYL